MREEGCLVNKHRNKQLYGDDVNPKAIPRIYWRYRLYINLLGHLKINDSETY